jgi:phage terminase large subunit-like protein
LISQWKNNDITPDEKKLKLPRSLLKDYPDLWIPPGVDIENLPAIEAPDKAIAVIETGPRLFIHTKAKWMGKPFKQLAWQWIAEWRIFGSMDDSGLRRYRYVYIQIPKKNGKSEWMARLAIFFLSLDGEKGAEVISAAATKEQAGMVYTPATFMVQNHPVMKKQFRVYKSRGPVTNSKEIVYLGTERGNYWPTTGDAKAKQGPSPSAIFCDEISEWTGQAGINLYKTLTEESQSAREQPIVVHATTGNVYEEGSIYQTLKTKAIAAEKDPDAFPDWLSILFLPTAEDIKILEGPDFPTDEMILRLNPAIGPGRIFDLGRIRTELKSAKNDPDPSRWKDKLRFRANHDISAISAWMSATIWDKGDYGPIDIDALENMECFAGLDLSGVEDLSAYVILFPPTGGNVRIKIICKAYLPKERLRKLQAPRGDTPINRDVVPYQQWADEGWLTLTPGRVINPEVILKDIGESSYKYIINDLGIDPHYATTVIPTLEEEYGMDITTIHNRPINLNATVDNIMKAAVEGYISHGGNPILAWAMGNLRLRTNHEGMQCPYKESKPQRIDPAMALFYAWNRWDSWRD